MKLEEEERGSLGDVGVEEEVLGLRGIFVFLWGADQKKVKQKVIPNVESWNPTNNPKQKKKSVQISCAPLFRYWPKYSTVPV